MLPVPIQDLEEITAATAAHWEQMRGQALFLTGGTGFFGKWLVESFLHSNRALDLQASITILTRNPQGFQLAAPHLAGNPAVTLLEGDVRDFHFPAGRFPFVLHAATEASAHLLEHHPDQMLHTVFAGTEHVLRFAAQAGTRKLLLTSSGAIYGRQPSTLSHIPEGFTGAPDPALAGSAYGEGKRLNELMGAIAAQLSAASGTSLEVKIARCFAFSGPHLPVGSHFALGNFLNDALHQRPIRIAGDGTTLRSYLYASDLCTWLWTMLFSAPSLRPFNVGSPRAVSIRELAECCAQLPVLAGEPPLAVHVAGTPTGEPPARYIPSVTRALEELGLRETVTLEDGLARMYRWHRSAAAAANS